MSNTGEQTHIVAKAELHYGENKGAKITSTCSDDQTEWELLLASMLLETVAVRQGWTVEETAEILLGSIEETGPMQFNITRDVITDDAE